MVGMPSSHWSFILTKEEEDHGYISKGQSLLIRSLGDTKS